MRPHISLRKKENNHKQMGDPEKAARFLYKIAERETLPQILTIGKDCSDASLKHYIGLSQSEMGKILGVTEHELQGIETGTKSISWDQYLTMLFIFHYNGRTGDIVENLGLYPKALQESLKIGR